MNDNDSKGESKRKQWKSVYCFCDGVHDGVYFVPVANTISV